MADLVHLVHHQPRVRRHRARERRERRDQAAGEDVALDPVRRLAIALPAVVRDQNRLDAGDAARLEQPVDRGEVGAELALADRLEHLDRRDLGVAAFVAPVVLFEDPDVEPSRSLSRERRLFRGDRQAGHAAAVLGRGEAREAAPAAADLEHAILLDQPQPLADPPVLAPLGIRERLVGVLEDGARVGHRLVEHQLEEVVAEVVVVGDVAARAKEAVPPVQAWPRLEEPSPARVPVGRRRRIPEQQLEQRHEVVAVPFAGRVRLADAELPARRDPPEEGVVVNRQVGDRAAPEAADLAARGAAPRAFLPRAARARDPGSTSRSARGAAVARAAARRGGSVRCCSFADRACLRNPGRGRKRACGGTARA